jgi:hypothetical protein
MSEFDQTRGNRRPHFAHTGNAQFHRALPGPSLARRA